MVLKIVTSSFLLILTSVSPAIAPMVAAVPAPARVRPVSYFGSCNAICAHPSHGSIGWLGPTETGDNAKDKAWVDAKAHNKDNPGHDASPNCG
jgi:hypothetical protein